MVGYSSRWRKNLTFDDFTWNFQVHRITIPRATSFVNIFLSLLNTVDGEKKHRAARPRPPIHIFPRLFNPPNVSITIWPRRLLCLPGWWRWQRECLWMTSNVRIVWKCWIMWLPHRPRRRPERESVETWKILTLFGLYERLVRQTRKHFINYWHSKVVVFGCPPIMAVNSTDSSGPHRCCWVSAEKWTKKEFAGGSFQSVVFFLASRTICKP